MKRFIVRFFLVTSVVALGLLAYYAQAQRGADAVAVATPETHPAVMAPEGEPQPIQTATESSDPFASDQAVRHAAAEFPIETSSVEEPSTRAVLKPIDAEKSTADSQASGTPYNQLRKQAKSDTSGYQPPAASAYAPPAPSAAAPAAQAYTPPTSDTTPSGTTNALPEFEFTTVTTTVSVPETAPAPRQVAKAPAPMTLSETDSATAIPAPTGPAPISADPFAAAPTTQAAPAPLPAADSSAQHLGTSLPGMAPPAAAPVQTASAPAPRAAATPPSYKSATTSSVAGTGRPGSKQLEGTQTPQLQLRKKAPKEIQVGKSAKFQVFVRNSGSAAAHDVRITDQVPKGTRLLDTKPQANISGDGYVTWNLGSLEPGEEKAVTLQIMPETEGEIGSVASVEFRAEAAARTIATRPQLAIEVSSPKKVMIGEDIAVTLQISNPGTGVASGVTLYNSLPAQLKHEAGSELEFEVGDLAPRESRQIELTLTAAGAGQLLNVIEARGEGTLSAQGRMALEVIAPQLNVSLDGPKRRFLERKAVYALSISNSGTAAATNVELVSHLPKGIDFVSANNAGHYDEGTHAVYWSLAELPEGESGAVEMVTMPVESGDHKIVVEGKADRDLTDQLEETIAVEGLAALVFEVVDVQDPVEVGGEAEYEIRVLNQGTKSASGLVVMAHLPPGLRAVSAEGPTRGSVEGSRIVFEPLGRLAPKADTTYRVRAEGLQAGDQRIRVQLQSDDHRQPVTKEESTLIYADR